MRIASVGALAFALAAAAVAEDVPGPPPTLEKRDPGDESLATAVGRALEDDRRVNAMKIKVAVDGGVVTLTGSAKDVADKNATEAVVRRVAGVRDVRNELAVERTGDPAPGASVIPEVPSPPR